MRDEISKFLQKKEGGSLRLLLIWAALAYMPLILMAQTPRWWSQRGITNGNPANDYAAANQGQVKNIIAISSTNQYPWTGQEASANDYAIANIGQVKNLFSFDFTLDTDGNAPHAQPLSNQKSSGNPYGVVLTNVFFESEFLASTTPIRSLKPLSKGNLL